MSDYCIDGLQLEPGYGSSVGMRISCNTSSKFSLEGPIFCSHARSKLLYATLRH